MFKKIILYSQKISHLASLASASWDDKQRERIIKKIMKLTEKIEDIYSSNWHYK
jgi:hypothetical protein